MQIKKIDERDWNICADDEVILRIPEKQFTGHDASGSDAQIDELKFRVGIDEIINSRFDGIFFRAAKTEVVENGLEKFIYFPSIPEVTLEKLCAGKDITEAELEELYEWHETKSFAEFTTALKYAAPRVAI